MSSIFGRGEGRVSFDEFCAAVKNSGYPEPSHATYWTFLNEARNVHIFDKQELAMVLAHFIHESEGFVETREKVNVDNYPDEYYDSTCDVPGQLYYGRGYLKITHCKQYRDTSLDLYNDERLVQEPDLVAKDEEIAMKVGFSLWKRNVQGVPGFDEGHFGVTTNAIRGSLECLGPNQKAARKRFEIYKEVRKAFKLKHASSEAEKGCYEMEQFAKAVESFSKQ